ncbi:hypothetical protein DTO032I3_4427 [Paecilomyces variotii]|nr:hypothetical protein DTO032I3_4427 [Paecilomyces variotii]
MGESLHGLFGKFAIRGAFWIPVPSLRSRVKCFPTQTSVHLHDGQSSKLSISSLASLETIFIIETTHVFHAELDHCEREMLVQSFCTKPSSHHVLICSFYVNSAGSNPQNLCRNVHLWDIPTSDRYVQQAVGRVRRLGQTHIVKVYDYYLDKSFNSRQLSLNLNKLVPSLVTELNSNIINVDYDKENKMLDLGKWAENLGGTLSFVKPEHYVHVDAFPDRVVGAKSRCHNTTTLCVIHTGTAFWCM